MRVKMKKQILLILIGSRKKSAVTVQKVLTAWGCMIKTRLGIHDGVLDECTDSGLLILEVVGDKKKHKEMARKLNLIKGVKTKFVELSV